MVALTAPQLWSFILISPLPVTPASILPTCASLASISPLPVMVASTDRAAIWAMEISPLPMIHIHNDWVFIAPSQRTDPLPFMRIPVR